MCYVQVRRALYQMYFSGNEALDKFKLVSDWFCTHEHCTAPVSAVDYSLYLGVTTAKLLIITTDAAPHVHPLLFTRYKKRGCLLAVVFGNRHFLNWLKLKQRLPRITDGHLNQQALSRCGITDRVKETWGWKQLTFWSGCILFDRVWETACSSELKVIERERDGDRQGQIPTSNCSGQDPRHFNKAHCLLQ